jgi:hypothetical protein
MVLAASGSAATIGWMIGTGERAPVDEWPVFDTANVLWFFGGLSAATACDGVIGQVHAAARGTWILLVSLAFLAVFAALSAALLRAGWWIPGGVLAAMAVTFVGPAAAAFERLIGVWRGAASLDPIQEFEGPDFALVAVVGLAALVAFALVRFHFILLQAAVASFVALQLLVPVVVANPSLSDHATALLVAGAMLMLVGLALDALRARRAAFWWHLVGLVGLAVGLAYHAVREGATWGWVMIFVVGTIVLVLASVLRRGTWAVFGVAGFYAPIAHYVDVWLGNLGAALALAVVGIALVGIGIAARRSYFRAASA